MYVYVYIHTHVNTGYKIEPLHINHFEIKFRHFIPLIILVCEFIVHQQNIKHLLSTLCSTYFSLKVMRSFIFVATLGPVGAAKSFKNVRIHVHGMSNTCISYTLYVIVSLVIMITV